MERCSAAWVLLFIRAWEQRLELELGAGDGVRSRRTGLKQEKEFGAG